jgi:hypothetical protein
VLKGGAQCGKMVKGRSKEKADGAGDLAAKMRWLQEQAAKRLAGSRGREGNFLGERERESEEERRLRFTKGA